MSEDIRFQIEQEVQSDGSIREFEVSYRVEPHDSAGLPEGLAWVTVLSRKEIIK